MNPIKRQYYRKLVQYLRYNSDDDEKFVRTQYYYKTGRSLNLENPREFTEKLQWLKLYKYGEDYGDYVDKYAVRNYVKTKIGPQYLTALYGVVADPETINLEKLPPQFVLKGTHGSGYNILIPDKSKLNWKRTKRKLHQFLNKNYYLRCRERVYKNVKPRIIIEGFLNPGPDQSILDYKVLCFNGRPKAIYVEKQGVILGYYDLEWNKLDTEVRKTEVAKPENLDGVIKVAQSLAAGFIFLRVDLYLVKNKIYFGELTFFDYAGIKRLHPEYLNKKFGDWVILPSREET